MGLRQELEGNFNPAAAAGVDLVIALEVRGSAPVRFAVAGGAIAFEPDAAADVTFYFDSEATARAIVLGGADPMPAFMDGAFASDGHLPAAFALMSMFRPGSRLAVPE